MEMFDVSFLGAAFAGFLSFGSPCVLPLVPAYLCFLGGTSLDQLSGDEVDGAVTRRVVIAATAFVLGFSAVFVAMGASASALSGLLLDNMRWLSIVAGSVIVVFGLHYMAVLNVPFLNFERRVHVEARAAGLVGPFIIGMAFAFGWTPCVGPILATILMIAASERDVWYGTGLLAAYAAGLGLPFLVAAFACKPFLRLFARFRRHMRTVELAIGGLLVATGLLILTNSVSIVSAWLLDALPAFGRIG